MYKSVIRNLLVFTVVLLLSSIVHAQNSSNNVSPLIKKLIYSNEDIKVMGRKELSTLDPSAKAKLIPELLLALKYFNKEDRNQIVTRYRAAETLGLLGPVAKDTAPDLIQAMKNDESDIVRSHAATSLGQIGLEPEKIAPILLDAMNDKRIWLESAKAIAALGPKAIPTLTDAIKSNNKAIQIGAAVALGKMGPTAKGVAPTLEQAIASTKDERTKDAFQEALKKIGSADLITPYENRKLRYSIPDQVVFLSTGPQTGESTALRFILEVQEIYYSIVIQELKYGSVEGEPTKFVHSFVISDTDIKRAINQQELTNLQFKRWNKWNEFELEINGQIYSVQYTSTRKFKMTVAKNT